MACVPLFAFISRQGRTVRSKSHKLENCYISKGSFSLYFIFKLKEFSCPGKHFKLTKCNVTSANLSFPEMKQILINIGLLMLRFLPWERKRNTKVIHTFLTLSSIPAGLCLSFLCSFVFILYKSVGWVSVCV